jgi:hypothetical protein
VYEHLDCLQTADASHVHIDECQIEPVPLGLFDPGNGAARFDGLVTKSAQHGTDAGAQGRVVIDDEYAKHGISPWIVSAHNMCEVRGDCAL